MPLANDTQTGYLLAQCGRAIYQHACFGEALRLTDQIIQRLRQALAKHVPFGARALLD